jgi:hypothetical protein
VIRGGKNVENRRWRTTYRGLLLIHAAKDPDPDPGVADALLWTMADPGAFGQPRTAFQARGAIIGLVYLADVLTDSPSRWAAVGQYHWLLNSPPQWIRRCPARGARACGIRPERCWRAWSASLTSNSQPRATPLQHVQVRPGGQRLADQSHGV